MLSPKRNILLLISCLLLSSCISRNFKHHASLYDYRDLFRASQTFQNNQKQLKLTYFGTTTALISDGQTSLMLDGFFTRPNLGQTFLGKIESNSQLIKQVLKQNQIKQLDAVITFHSHYDHAMDAPEVCHQTGAVLLGSESTANIARGVNLPEKQIRAITPHRTYTFGKFKVRFIPSKHAQIGSFIANQMLGHITKPLKQPAKFSDFKEGGTFAILIEHPRGNTLLHSSFLGKPEDLKNYHFDTLLMSMPGFSKQSSEEQEKFFKHVILERGVQTIIPVHWDNFFIPLERPLRPFPEIAVSLKKTLNFLKGKLKSHPHIQLRMLDAFEKINLSKSP